MKKLDKRRNTVPIIFETNEGERRLLSSNKGSNRSPSLDLGITPQSSEEELVDILADILVEGFIQNYERGNTEKGSNLLQGINKRAG